MFNWGSRVVLCSTLVCAAGCQRSGRGVIRLTASESACLGAVALDFNLDVGADEALQRVLSRDPSQGDCALGQLSLGRVANLRRAEVRLRGFDSAGQTLVEGHQRVAGDSFQLRLLVERQTVPGTSVALLWFEAVDVAKVEVGVAAESSNPSWQVGSVAPAQWRGPSEQCLATRLCIALGNVPASEGEVVRAFLYREDNSLLAQCELGTVRDGLVRGLSPGPEKKCGSLLSSEPQRDDAGSERRDAGSPPPCDEHCVNGCLDGVCEWHCPTTGECNCPAGWPCRVICNKDNPCPQPIDCSQATACEIRCEGVESCRSRITCGSGSCEVIAAARDAAEGLIDCSRASSCEIQCLANYSCRGGINCGGRQCRVACEVGNSCFSTIDCGTAQVCDIYCAANYGCNRGSLVGGTGHMRVTCAGRTACNKGVDCRQSCGCSVFCPVGDCGGPLQCPAGCPSCGSTDGCQACE